MNLQLFYDEFVSLDKPVALEPAEATHVAKVLRLRTGDSILITDGKGSLYLAQLEIERHRAVATARRQLSAADSPMGCHLGIAPTKNADRIEWLVEKAVEIGVGSITLIGCDHSERPKMNTERLKRVAVSALKQSRRTYLPVISDLMVFPEWLKTINADVRCIAHCHGTLTRNLLQHVLKSGQTAAIAIGPEGDFSEAEVSLAIASGFEAVSLGDARLRTETAGLAAIHTYSLLQQLT